MWRIEKIIVPLRGLGSRLQDHIASLDIYNLVPLHSQLVMDCKTNYIFGKSSTFTCKQSKQKVWSEASFFSHSHALSECEACRICVWNSDAMLMLQIVKKKKVIWEKDQFFWSLYCKLVTFFSFRLRSLANVMDGRIPIPHQHPVEWTSLSPLLTWQTHAAVAATPLVPTSHTYMTFQKMNLIDCCAW